MKTSRGTWPSWKPFLNILGFGKNHFGTADDANPIATEMGRIGIDQSIEKMLKSKKEEVRKMSSLILIDSFLIESLF